MFRNANSLYCHLRRFIFLWDDGLGKSVGLLGQVLKVLQLGNLDCLAKLFDRGERGL